MVYNRTSFRLEGHTNPPPLSLLQYSIIIPKPSLWRELSRLSAARFLFQVDGSILVRNPFSYEHLSQCVHYSWRPIAPDRLSCPRKKKRDGGGGRRHVWTTRVRQTLTDHWILREWIVEYCCAVTSLCGWKAFSLINVQRLFACVCTGMCEADTDLVCWECVCICVYISIYTYILFHIFACAHVEMCFVSAQPMIQIPSFPRAPHYSVLSFLLSL